MNVCARSARLELLRHVQLGRPVAHRPIAVGEAVGEQDVVRRHGAAVVVEGEAGIGEAAEIAVRQEALQGSGTLIRPSPSDQRPNR